MTESTCMTEMSELFNISNVADITELTDLNDLLTLLPSRNSIRRPRYTENDLQSWYWHCSFAGGPNIIYSPCTGTVGRNNLPRLDLKVRSTPKYHYIQKHSLRMYTLFQNSVKDPFARFSRKSQYLDQKSKILSEKSIFLAENSNFFPEKSIFWSKKSKNWFKKSKKYARNYRLFGPECPKCPNSHTIGPYRHYRHIPTHSAHTDLFGTHRLIRHTSFHPFGTHRLIVSIGGVRYCTVRRG